MMRARKYRKARNARFFLLQNANVRWETNRRKDVMRAKSVLFWTLLVAFIAAMLWGIATTPSHL
jgi:hypothetical protein